MTSFVRLAGSFILAMLIAVALLLGVAPRAAVANEIDKIILSQNINVQTPSSGNLLQGRTEGLISQVPGANALTPEQVERLGRDAAQRVGRSRALQLKQQQDRINEARRRTANARKGPRNNDPGILDCDDNKKYVNPGVAEVCNGIDDDCDGLIDHYPPSTGIEIRTRVYADLDGDGFGDAGRSELVCLIGDTLQRLSAELAESERKSNARYVLTAGDCDDRKADVNPNNGDRCDQ